MYQQQNIHLHQAENERKRKRAVLNIKFYTYIAEIVLLVYLGLFVYVLLRSNFDPKIFISFFINTGIIAGSSTQCEKCRHSLRLSTPLYAKAKKELNFAMCLQMTYFCLYAAIAGALYFYSNGEAFYASIALLLYVTPCLLIALLGCCVVRNFKILLVPVALYQASNGPQPVQQAQQFQEVPVQPSQPVYGQFDQFQAQGYQGGFFNENLPAYSLTNNESSTAAYFKAPEPLGVRGR